MLSFNSKGKGLLEGDTFSAAAGTTIGWVRRGCGCRSSDVPFLEWPRCSVSLFSGDERVSRMTRLDGDDDLECLLDVDEDLVGE